MENQAGAGTVQVLLVAGEDHLDQAIRQILAEGSSRIELLVSRPRGGSPRSLPGDEGPRRHARRLPVRQAEGVIRYLDVDEIDWIEAANQYVRLHSGKKTYLIRESMARLESWLDPERFLRIHRSAIVHLDRVEELRMSSPAHRWAVLRNGESLRVSPQSWEALQAALLGCS